MTNARLLLDALLAVALTTLLTHASPTPLPLATLAAFITMAGSYQPLLASHRTPARKTMAHNSRAKTRQAGQFARRGLTYTVTATAYQAVPGQTDAKPFVTADNSLIKAHYGSRRRWMALSNDLLKRWGGQFDYGDQVRVRGISAELDGIYTVHDTMNRRHRHCMDVLTHKSENVDIFATGVRIQKISF